MRGQSLFALLVVAFTAACSSDPSGSDVTTSGGPPGIDAGGSSGGPITPDSGGGTDSGSTSGGIDAGPPDTTAPLAVSDLAATAAGTTAIALTFTAPADPPNSTVSTYEIRRSTTNITSATDFNVATPVTAPTPKSPGSPETATATGLLPETTYYFAVRAKDAAGNVGPISNVASATTKARATLLLSEVAMLNGTGQDFIELVVTKAGNVKDLVVRQAQSPNSLHTFGDLDVALDDRIVVHLTNLPGPAGFAQEDVLKSKTASTETTTGMATAGAWDVYSTAENLVGTDNLITVVDGTTTMDAVAYSDRDGDAAAAVMTGWAAAKTATAWGFSADPVDATNDCATQREAVAVSTGIGNSNGACGRMQTNIAAGFSINRSGTTDTHTKKDWYVAAQTPGATNAAIPAPTILNAIATSLTTVDIRFDQEIDSATVAAGVFTGSGVTVNAAALNEPAIVTLTTSTQTGPHTIGIDAALKTIYGASVPTSVGFCVYEPLGGMVAITEVNPTIAGADLVELQVTRAGLIGGGGGSQWGVRENPTAASGGGLVVNFPAGFCVALDDLIVVHMEPTVDMLNETTAKNQVPAATVAAYYDNAWDLRGGATGLLGTDSVLAVRDAAGTYVDAVAITNADGTAGANYLTSLAYVQSLGLWLPADCGGAACTDATTPTAQGVGASRVGTDTASASGDSLRKSSAGAARTAASWSVGASSWGAINP